MAAPANTREFLLGLIEPAVLLPRAAYHYAAVLFDTVFKKGQLLAPLLRSREIRDEAFGRFWVDFSVRGDDEPLVNVDETQLQGSAALVPPLLARASGVVLDVGPGTGTQMPFLRKRADSDAIRAIYGAEPCVGLHAQLRRRVLAAGLEGKYHIVPSGAEKEALLPALDRLGVSVAGEGGGIFDTIICVRVLCSVPDPARTIADLYSLLRPGGKMLVVEHVVNPWPRQNRKKGSFLARLMQALYSMLGWSFFMGDCHLDRDTTGYLLQAAEKDGGWESVELEHRWEWSAMPYISGVLVKRAVN